VALFQHLGWMLDALAPRHVGDVDEPVNLLLDLHERTELGEVAHLAGDLGAHGILVGKVVPRVGLDLLEPERNAPCRGIHAEHHALHRVAHIQDRSEEHTSELQSRFDLVCRLLLEKKKSRQLSSSSKPPSPMFPTSSTTSSNRPIIPAIRTTPTHTTAYYKTNCIRSST